MSPQSGIHAEEKYTFTNLQMFHKTYDESVGDQIEIGTNVSTLVLLPGMRFWMDLSDEEGNNYTIHEEGFADKQIFHVNDGLYYVNDDATPGTYTIPYNYTDESNHTITSTLTITVFDNKDLSYKIGYYNDSPYYYQLLEDTAQQTTNNLFKVGSQKDLKLVAYYKYTDVDHEQWVEIVDDKMFPVYSWSSSDESVASIDKNGTLTFKGDGNSTITCRAKGTNGEITVTGNVFGKEEGVYVTKYSDVSRITLGKSLETDWSINIIGEGLVPDWAYGLSKLLMILDNNTINMLNEKSLLGYDGVLDPENPVITFVPDASLHTIWAIKGSGNCAPFLVRCKDLAGMTITGTVVVPKKEACDYDLMTPEKAMYEACDCYKNEDNLNDLHITNPDGTTYIAKAMPFTIEFLDDTEENNMELIDEIEKNISSGKYISEKQKLYLGDLLYQLKHGYSVFDEYKEEKEFPLPEYSADNLGRIESVIKYVFGAHISCNIPEDVQVSNLTLCGESSNGNVPNQTLTLTKEDTVTSDITQKMMTEDQETVASYDINLYHQVDGEEETQITETVVPLGITIDTKTDLEGKNVEVIREHTNEDGVTTADILPCEVNGSQVSFSTNQFSAYTIVTSEDKSNGNQGGIEENKGNGTITDNSQNAKEEKSTNLTKTNKSIKTGDTTNVLLPMFCLTLSVIVILICRKKFYHR